MTEGVKKPVAHSLAVSDPGRLKKGPKTLTDGSVTQRAAVSMKSISALEKANIIPDCR